MIGQAIAKHMPLPQGAEDTFDAFHALLQRANQTMDLTAVLSDAEALHRHYLDSLTALPLLPEQGSVLDIGTGAGFPGVPLAIARPTLSFTLLDAQQKRVAFLQQAMQALSLPAKAVHARAEDYAREHREVFDIAVSRAVASLPVLLEWALPFVRVGGQCILWKGPGVQAELAEAQRVAPLLGGGDITLHDAPVPGQDWSHVLVVVEKKEPADARFPRKAGMAVKRPL